MYNKLLSSSYQSSISILISVCHYFNDHKPWQSLCGRFIATATGHLLWWNDGWIWLAGHLCDAATSLIVSHALSTLLYTIIDCRVDISTRSISPPKYDYI